MERIGEQLTITIKYRDYYLQVFFKGMVKRRTKYSNSVSFFSFAFHCLAEIETCLCCTIFQRNDARNLNKNMATVIVSFEDLIKRDVSKAQLSHWVISTGHYRSKGRYG